MIPVSGLENFHCIVLFSTHVRLFVTYLTMQEIMTFCSQHTAISVAGLSTLVHEPINTFGVTLFGKIRRPTMTKRAD